MPLKPTDCSKYVMYKLCCLDPNITDEYVGSTTNYKHRKNEHKSRCNNKNGLYYNFNIYQYIRANGGWSNWTMVQIEEYPCNSKREAEAREEQLRQQLKASLNMRRAFTTEEEYIEYQKKYNENNKEKIKERYEKNKEKYKKKKLNYYENNKEKLLEKSREKITCECGSIVRIYGLERHKKTSKHLKIN
jgi:vacuolar-type H+-ATPase subunit I/STV1